VALPDPARSNPVEIFLTILPFFTLAARLIQLGRFFWPAAKAAGAPVLALGWNWAASTFSLGAKTKTTTTVFNDMTPFANKTVQSN
jgi:hypothetical protein